MQVTLVEYIYCSQQLCRFGGIMVKCLHLPSLHKTLVWSLVLHKLSEVGDGHIWEREAGDSEDQGHPQLHNDFEASLGYVRSCQKTNKQSRVIIHSAIHVAFNYSLSKAKDITQLVECLLGIPKALDSMDKLGMVFMPVTPAVRR